MSLSMTTNVKITSQGISLEQGGKPEGKITTSLTRGPLAKSLKKFGISAVVGLVVGVVAWKRIIHKYPGRYSKSEEMTEEENNDAKRRTGLIIALVTLISMLGITFYEQNLFNIRYKYYPGFQVTSDIVTSIVRRNGFMIRKFGDNGDDVDYKVEYIDAENFVLKDSAGYPVFTTVDNDNYTFEFFNREDIGKYMPMLKNVQLRITVDGKQMRDCRDVITLAATLTYLHRKLRPVHIVGGLKLLGFVLPLAALVKMWYDIEKTQKDEAVDDKEERFNSTEERAREEPPRPEREELFERYRARAEMGKSEEEHIERVRESMNREIDRQRGNGVYIKNSIL